MQVLWLALLLALIAVAGAGCSHADYGDNTSARPWDSPKAWEQGMPAGMMNDQRN